MSNWQNKTLGEIVSLRRGHDLPLSKSKKGDIPIMGSSGLSGFHNESKAKGPGIVIGRSGVGSMGVVSYCDVDYWPHNTVLYVTDFHGNFPKFVYYLLKTINFKMYNSGSVQASLNRNYIKHIPLSTPDIEEQRAIAHILGTLDDKIEANRRMNETLEATARAIFKSWFVDFDPVHAKANGESPYGMDADTADLFPDSFQDSELGMIPTGWEVDKFQTQYNIVNGYAFKSKDYATDGTPIIRTRDFSSTKYVQISENIYLPDSLLENHQKHLLQPLDFLLIMVGASIGKYGIIFHKDLPALQNQNMWAIRPKTDSVLSRYFTIFMMPELIRISEGFATGSARSFFRKGTFYERKILVPERNLLRRFDEIAKPLIDKIGILLSENQTLAELRDTLLPRLISGELRVDDVSEFVGDV